MDQLKVFSDKLFDRFDLILLPFLALILLLPKFPLISVEGTYVNVRIEDFVVVGLYGLWGIGVLIRKYDLTEVFNWRAILGFLIYGFLITLSGIYLFKTVEEPHLGIIHWLRRVEYFLMYFVAATTLQREKVRDYLYFLLVVTVFALIYGFLQWKNVPLAVGVQTLSQAGKIGTFQDLNYLISTFAAHYDFGAFLMLIMPFSLAALFSEKKWTKKAILILLSFSIWWMARLVYARAAYLALIAVSFLFLALKKNLLAVLPIYEVIKTFDRYFGGKFSKYSYEFGFSFLPERAGGSSPPVSVPTPTVTKKLVKEIIEGKEVVKEVEVTPTPVVGREQAVSSLKFWLDNKVDFLSWKLRSFLGWFDVKLDPSGNIRLQEWQDVLANTGYHFLWGGGYYSVGMGADSDYVRHIAEVGVIGLAWFLLILKDFVLLFWRNFRLLENQFLQNVNLALMVGILGLLINAIFIDVFEASKIAFLFWFLMGIGSLNVKNQSSKVKATAKNVKPENS